MKEEIKMNNMQYTGFEVAVVGMACRFPGANNVAEFWQNIIDGKETISFFSDEELRKKGFSEDDLKNPNFVAAAGILDDSLCFDPAFFGYTPKEAEVMDPQVRVFHECIWSALEDSGYDSEVFKGRIGLYGGIAPNYHWEGYCELSGKNNLVGSSKAKYLNNKDFMAGLISYKLNLKGPAFSFYTACSTSLVAIHLACQALINGECEMALAGGGTNNGDSISGYLYREDMHMSKDGHNRTFSKDASGTVPSQGVGAVVLKRLSDAVRDRDHIYGVVKGSAINNDGTRKVGFMAPSVGGQTEVIRSALRMANLKSEDIGYVETHGTATKLGDPIEIASLTDAFGTMKKNYCALGSVKSNIGHTDCAAGVAGFIKTVLMLNNKLLPPSLHCNKVNPKINFKESPFYVNTELKKWDNISNYPLCAGVSAFGIGGTNAHAILCEAPKVNRSNEFSKEHLVVLSAKTESILENISENLVQFLKTNSDVRIADVAYSMNIGRRDFEIRKAIVAKNIDELIDKLSISNFDPNNKSTVNSRVNREVIFVFSGQGSQYVNVGVELYHREEVFKKEIDQCCRIASRVLDVDFFQILFPSVVNQQTIESINELSYSGPAKFIIEYAMAKLLISYGIEPTAMIGHSFGEFAVAVIAGVFKLEDAMQLIVARGKAMEKAVPGAMTSVPLSVEELSPLLCESLSVAAVNSSHLTIVSGAIPEIEKLEQQVMKMGFECLRLNFPRASHSKLMEISANIFKENVAKIQLNPPKIPYISGLTGQWVTPAEATTPTYWARHLVDTVQFSSGINELLKYKNPVFIQVGSDKGLPMIINQHKKTKSSFQSFNMLKQDKEGMGDYEFFLEQVGQLWLAGIMVDWQKYYHSKKGYRIPLPTYPFERNLFPFKLKELDGLNLREENKLSDISNWYYVPTWIKTNVIPKQSLQNGCWLIFNDKYGVGSRLSTELQRLNQIVVQVDSGEKFCKLNDRYYSIDTDNPGDYRQLIKELFESCKPDHIVHLCSLSNENSYSDHLLEIEKSLSDNYYSLIKLAQALGTHSLIDKISLSVITNNVFDIIGKDSCYPEKSSVLGPVKIIPLEYPNVSCRAIDVDFEECLNGVGVRNLLMELNYESEDVLIGHRNSKRWKQSFEPVMLDKSEEGASYKFRADGVYMITGGLGGIGFVLAKMLIQEYNANVILLGRTELENNSNANIEHHNLNERELRFQELKRLKSDIKYFNVDVSDCAEMNRLKNRLEKEYTKIDGILHLAGNPDGRLIQLRTQEDERNVFASKIKGTIIIERISQDLGVDFILYGSSRSSFIPSLAHVGHTAANNFIDTYVHYLNNVDDTKKRLSINWNAWGEIGQAYEANLLMKSKFTLDKLSKKNLDHVIFQNYYTLDDINVFEGILTVNDWIVGEHKIAGIYALPGTAYLELARMAMEIIDGSPLVSLEDVFFIQPFSINENEKSELRVLLKPDGEGYEFSVVSQLTTGEGGWKEHAIGRISALKKKQLSVSNFQSLKQRLINDGITQENIQAGNNDFKNFGERWSSEIRVVESELEVLKAVSLPDKFEEDLIDYQIHPALLDCAVGTSVKEGFYLPFNYNKVNLFKPLEKDIIVHVNNIKRINENRGTVSSDLLICNLKGELLLEVKGYSRLKSSGLSDRSDMDINRIVPKESDLLSRVKSYEFSNDSLDSLKESLTNTEGIEVFKRIMQVHEHYSQVIVSKSDISKYLLKVASLQTKDIDPVIVQKDTKALLIPRPNLSVDYVGPENSIQEKIANIVEDYLGFEKVGIQDDFFELGGDSLKAIYVLNSVYKEFSIRIPITEFFKAPTISKLSLNIEIALSGNAETQNANEDIEEVII
ncbi:MAG: SDR family NAD(P)-dependent oxidoreductase [Marinifilaceae bacterium]